MLLVWKGIGLFGPRPQPTGPKNPLVAGARVYIVTLRALVSEHGATVMSAVSPRKCRRRLPAGFLDFAFLVVFDGTPIRPLIQERVTDAIPACRESHVAYFTIASALARLYFFLAVGACVLQIRYAPACVPVTVAFCTGSALAGTDGFHIYTAKDLHFGAPGGGRLSNPWVLWWDRVSG